MKRVAVLRGGPSEEYDVSMLSGNAVLRALSESNYPHRDITITKNGDWLSEGKRLTQDQAFEGVDVVFVALQGPIGDSGLVQTTLKKKGIPFTGSIALATGIAGNKELTKQTLRQYGINLARHRRVNKEELSELKNEVAQIITDLGNEVFIKPLHRGSEQLTRGARTDEELLIALEELLLIYDSLLVEESLVGTQVTVGVLENFRNEELYTFPVVEFANILDVTSIPGRYSDVTKAELARLARLAHKEIGCSQYSQSNFIVKNGQVYFSSLQSHPDLTETSLYIQAAESVGLSYSDLVSHLIDTASF